MPNETASFRINKEILWKAKEEAVKRRITTQQFIEECINHYFNNK